LGTSRARSRLASQLALVTVLVAAASCGSFCGSSQAVTQPIAGYWSWEGDGVQQIKSADSGFEGTVVKVATFGQCAAPLGRVVLKLSGSGTHYTGQDEWFRFSDCARRFSNNAVVDLKNGNQIAHLCSTGPFPEVQQVSNCVDLTRIANFKPG
jgi:hypothetical protein